MKMYCRRPELLEEFVDCGAVATLVGELVAVAPAAADPDEVPVEFAVVFTFTVACTGGAGFGLGVIVGPAMLQL